MEDAIRATEKYVRAANFISAAQIYLQSNFLLEEKLAQSDIKPRLLGHWGTCPGINFIYAHLNNLIRAHNAEILFVLGTGHGFAALQANLYMERTLGKYYPEATQNEKGLAYLIKNFSWPYSFPSHSGPGAPGTILEGGELGYALSTAYGSVFDNPDLITACLIGDGEAETAATAAAWHLNKLVDPKTNGAVLPILNLNGYKISGPTIFGRMSNRELKSLFYGYGYEPIIVEGTGDKLYEKMAAAMESAYALIKEIQNKARSSDAPVVSPRFPMLIVKTPKGWTGIKSLRGQKIEGNCLSHQAVVPEAKTNRAEFNALSKWLSSYNFRELFDPAAGFIGEIKSIVPAPELRMGDNKHAFGGDGKELKLPDFREFAEDAARPGTIGSSSMRRIGLYLGEVFQLSSDDNNFRLFSPDEIYSNKLDGVFKSASRPFIWPLKKWDKDLSASGRVVEILSEHSLQGMLQGYVLTGRHGVFASYEAFIQVVSSMVDQYAKFLKVAKETPWRKDPPSLNYILTSSGWRQEHNGFSHQNPGFISNILHRQGCFAQVYFPPDGNSSLAVIDKCLRSRGKINVIVASKTLEPRWLTPECSLEELEQGLMVWDFASDPEPDIIISAIGDHMTNEALAAIGIIKREATQIKVRFVNVMVLSSAGIGNAECKVPIDFGRFFTAEKPVVFNFHGYPDTLKAMLVGMGCDSHRFSVHGFIENGSTTTPFDMQIRNGTSRYQLAQDVFGKMGEAGVIEKGLADSLIGKYEAKIGEHKKYIMKNGVDPEEITDWRWEKSG